MIEYGRQVFILDVNKEKKAIHFHMEIKRFWNTLKYWWSFFLPFLHKLQICVPLPLRKKDEKEEDHD